MFAGLTAVFTMPEAGNVNKRLKVRTGVPRAFAGGRSDIGNVGTATLPPPRRHSLATESVATDARMSPVVVPLPTGTAIALDTLWGTWWDSGCSDDPGRMTLLQLQSDPMFINQRMSLTVSELDQRILAEPKLKAQYVSLRAFATSPLYLARKGRPAITEGTFEDCMKTMREYLGYLRKYEKVDAADFLACLDGPKVLRFFAFRKGHRGNQVSTVTACMFQFKTVVRWFYSGGVESIRDDNDTVRAARELHDNLDVLVKQFKATAPPKHPVDLVQLEKEGKWVPWPKARLKTEEYARRTLVKVRALRGTRRGVMTSRKAISIAARLNTAAFGMLFVGGLNVGTPRPSLLRNLVLKGANGEDTHAVYCSVCKRDECVGNIISKTANGDYEMVQTHHKMAKKLGTAIPKIAITKETEGTAHAIFEELFDWGHATHVASYGSSAESSSSDRLRLFRKSANGAVFTVGDHADSAASMYVIKLVADVLGEPRSGMHITATTLRRMYSTWLGEKMRRMAGDHKAVVVAGAAVSMGTSVAMLETRYDMGRKLDLVKSAQTMVRQLYDADKVRRPEYVARC